MNKKIIVLCNLLLLILSTAACKNNRLQKKDITITRQDNTTIIVNTEIAKTQEEMSHGFMERKKIPDGTGMIFVYNHDLVLSFWMKNTPHPLSIAYIDSKGVIREIYDMTPYSLSPIKSKVSLRYALEVPQGWFSKNNITEGDSISLDFLN